MAVFEITVQSLGSGGVGVGTLPSGKVVFLPRTAPGDRVRVDILKEKPRWAMGVPIEWLEEGEGRRPPPCPRYEECSGCSFQHLEYEEQVKAKAHFVGDALRRIGKLDLPDPKIIPSPNETRYRNRMTFTLRRLPGEKVVAGLREHLKKGRVLDLGPECLLPEEALAELWRELRAGWGPNASLLPAGRELRLSLRTERGGGGLTIKGGQGKGDPEQLLAQVNGLTSIWREGREGNLEHIAGESELSVFLGGEEIPMGGSGFTQVNPGAGELLYAYVLGQVAGIEGVKIVDAYCGLGILGRAMARLGNEVIGIDIHPSPAGAETPGGTFRAVKGRVEEELAGVLPAGLVLLNPPRTGVGKAVSSILTDHPVPRILYVSCDQGTLGRDLERLGSQYTVQSVRCFDLFPQTEHVETVVNLEGPTS